MTKKKLFKLLLGITYRYFFNIWYKWAESLREMGGGGEGIFFYAAKQTLLIIINKAALQNVVLL